MINGPKSASTPTSRRALPTASWPRRSGRGRWRHSSMKVWRCFCCWSLVKVIYGGSISRHSLRNVAVERGVVGDVRSREHDDFGVIGEQLF